MNKKIYLGIALAALVAGADLCHAAGLTFSRAEPEQSTSIMKWGGNERQALEQAIDVHNLMTEVRSIRDLERQLAVTAQMRQLEEMRLNAMEKCSVNKLGEQFKNPKEVWDKMNAEYDKRERELTAFVNSTKMTPEEEQAFTNYMQTGEMTPEMVAEQYAPWRIGQEILMDVYQNQDKWGERKDAKAPSFPLWEDQKFQYDQDWDNYYTELNKAFGAPSEGRPIVGDEKYDYAKADEVKKAHQAYVAMLAAKNPAKGKSLAAEFKEPPMPPKPLPPKDEMVIYFETDAGEASVYPELPEPWQKYAENDFKNVNPNGEMARDFKSGLILKEQSKNTDQTNRLTAFAGRRQALDDVSAVEGLSLNHGDSKLGKVYAKLEKYMELEPNGNLLQEKTREVVLKRLQAKQAELVALAEKELQTRTDDKEKMVPSVNWDDIEELAELKKLNPKMVEQIQKQVPMSVYEQDENVIKALKKDTEGRVYINEANAGDVDKLLKEETARRAFVDGQNDLEKMLAEGENVKIDETCLNGGI
ncbi:MAG: hypothetical protein SPL08_03740 [Pseudomonadota bacterium]|nr:hypothetical protein [Pseudomonadota bacterium]